MEGKEKGGNLKKIIISALIAGNIILGTGMVHSMNQNADLTAQHKTEMAQVEEQKSDLQALLEDALNVVERRGSISDSQLEAWRNASDVLRDVLVGIALENGFSEQEARSTVGELIGHGLVYTTGVDGFSGQEIPGIYPDSVPGILSALQQGPERDSD